jgi:hypothetical protein
MKHLYGQFILVPVIDRKMQHALAIDTVHPVKSRLSFLLRLERPIKLGMFIKSPDPDRVRPIDNVTAGLQWLPMTRRVLSQI